MSLKILLNKMIVNFGVFSVLMGDMIRCNVYDNLIVTLNLYIVSNIHLNKVALKLEP